MKAFFVCPRTIRPLDPNCDELVPDNHLSVGSLKSSGLADVETCYFDDFHRERDETAEEFVISYCAAEKPDLVVFTGLRTEIFRCEEVLQKLASYGTPTVHLWWDHVSPDNQALANFYTENRLSLNVIMDISKPLEGEDPEHYMNLWYPLDRQIFYYDSTVERDIDVCFMGTVFPGYFQDRVDYLTHLHKQGIKFFSKTGVYSNQPLKIMEYADKLRSSRIGLNFTYMPHFKAPHCKTRTFETIACGAMLLEQDNEHTWRWFKPGQDYVPFEDPEDLEFKIKYYLAHEEERAQIARHGWETLCKHYTERAFWEKVFEKLSLTSPT